MITDGLPRQQRFDAFGREAEIQQRHALARRREQRAFLRITERAKPERIAGDDHIAQRVQKHKIISPVKPPADVAKHVDQRGR